MALTIDAITAASFSSIHNEARRPENQWGDSTLLDTMEKMGMIDRENFGLNLEITLDYRRNPDAEFLATELAPVPTSKPEILTAAIYSIGEISVPMAWSRKDEVRNPSENQKVDFVQTAVTNLLDSHDDLLEQTFFASAVTNNFNPVSILIPTSGQGSPGGIDASTELMWRNPTDSFLADGSDIEAVFTSVYNDASKGSGSKRKPTLMFSGSDTHALFESTQTPQIRYDSQNIKAGAKSLQFKTCSYVFSQYGGTSVYFANSTNLKLKVSKGNFRDLGEKIVLENAHGWKRMLYSAVQLVTSAKSRLGVAYQA